MSSTNAHPLPPAGLDAPGRALWSAILGDLEADWQLDSREIAALTEACRISDQIAALDRAVDADGAMVRGSRGQSVVHPAVGAARQLRLAQLRLLGSIEMVDPTSAIKSATPAQRRARSAAQARWAERNALKAGR